MNLMSDENTISRQGSFSDIAADNSHEYFLGATHYLN